MKLKCLLFILTAVSLSACSTTKPAHKKSSEADPETMLVSYRVKPGKQAEFQAVLARAWQIFRSEHMVFARPHALVQVNEEGGKIRFVEIFTWVSHAAPDNAPADVKAIWAREQSLCEARDGHPGIEGDAVEPVEIKKS